MLNDPCMENSEVSGRKFVKDPTDQGLSSQVFVLYFSLSGLFILN